MPMNLATALRARIMNNIRTKLPEYEVMRRGNSLQLSSRESDSSEYNETTTSAEWVDPYVKMDKKTNRYRKVSGYWRDVQKPVRTNTITGEATFAQQEPKEMIATLLKKR